MTVFHGDDWQTRGNNPRFAWGLALFWGFCQAFLIAACGANASSEESCAYTYECPTGEICQDGRCIDVSFHDGVDVGEDASDGELQDGGNDVGDGRVDDAESEPRRPFVSDAYRRCFDSLECAVFGGNCIVELTLSRPAADGTERIPLSSLDPSLAEGQGVCSLPCTNEPGVCDSLVITSADGQAASASCQLVYAAASPYPSPRPGMPFDSLLDFDALERGVPYASICRPPFQYAAAHSPRFCQPCASASDCNEGDGCLLERAYAKTPSGSCVQSCAEQADCPFGFSCTEVKDGDALFEGAEGRYCLPFEGTCGRCLDQDGDQRGIGACGPVDAPYTAIDCDDTNPNAYYDPKRPRHPFPKFCGEIDLNCNGISDEVEQRGSVDHCGHCGDPCSGRVAHGSLFCAESTGSFGCSVRCDDGFANCDGDISNGCERALEAEMLWFRDADGDGRGNPNEFRFFCGEERPGEGWVQNYFDCDDRNPLVYGGGQERNGVQLDAHPELCDGIDNNCDGRIDEHPVEWAVDDSGIEGWKAAGTACETGLHGVCAAGFRVCEAGSGDASTRMICKPTLEPAVRATVPETCNGIDDNCDGRIDEDVDWFRDARVSNPNPGAAATCSVPGGVGICASGTRVCGGAVDTRGCDPDPSCIPTDGPDSLPCCWVCEPNLPEAEDRIGDGIDSNCDGIDGDVSKAVFVRRASDGYRDGNDANPGTPLWPVATLERAVELACDGSGPDGACRDIYIEAETFALSTTLQAPTPPSDYTGELPWLRIYGGFQAELDCPGGDEECGLVWSRGDRRTRLRRLGPSFPLPTVYAGVSAHGSGEPLQLLLNQVDVEVEPPSIGFTLGGYLDAPAQVGILCPQQGCSRLVLDEVRIQVSGALPGLDGEAGEPGAVPEEGNDGIDGCLREGQCMGGVGPGDPDPDGETNFMVYGSAVCVDSYESCERDAPEIGLHSYRREAATCFDGRQPHGGNSGAWRFRGAKPGGGYYNLVYPKSGGGYPGQGPNPGSAGAAITHGGGDRTGNAWGGNGGHGRGGAGGRYSAVSILRFDASPSFGATFVDATLGGTGGGGGGASGCVRTGSGDSWIGACEIPGIKMKEHRGGAGGAGGCGGSQGMRGGNGGYAIGILLRPPTMGALYFPEPKGFQLIVGAGGDGGAGGEGGDGAAGGWGGAGDDAIRIRMGGNGGNGGGGGGGVGGHGGSSIGIWRVCTRPGAPADCGIKLPPKLGAQPGLFISAERAGEAGQGGSGGRAGQKARNLHGRTEVNAATPGGDGEKGAQGLSRLLYESEGS